MTQETQETAPSAETTEQPPAVIFTPEQEVEVTKRVAAATDQLSTTIGTLRSRVWALENQTRDTVTKDRIREVAMEYQRRHGLCDDGIWEALEELGITRPRKRVTAELTVTYSVEFYTTGNDPDASDIQDAIYLDGASLDGDSDWEDADVTEDGIYVRSVSVEDES